MSDPSQNPKAGSQQNNSAPTPITSDAITTYEISGTITDKLGKPLKDTAVELSGSANPKSCLTDAEGKYRFSDLAKGNYKLAPVLAHYSFDSRDIKLLDKNENINFTGTLVKYRIKGKVRDQDGNFIAGVKVEISGKQKVTARTNRYGQYTSPELSALERYTITASKPAHIFAPPSYTIESLTENSSKDFTAQVQFYTISGVVLNSDGTPISGVNVALEGGQSYTVKTDDGGLYDFSTLPGARKYTVTPSKAGCTFTPLVQSIAYLAGDVSQYFYSSTNSVAQTEKTPNQWTVINDYSKTIITLASGFLAVTVTFSAQLIGKESDETSNHLLTLTWVLLVAAITCGVFTAAYLIQFLRKGKGQRPAIFFSNASYFLLLSAGILFLIFGARIVYSNKTSDAATAVEKTLKRMPDITQRKNSKWSLKSLLWNQESKTYQIVVTEETTTKSYQVTVDPTKNDVINFEEVIPPQAPSTIPPVTGKSGAQE